MICWAKFELDFPLAAVQQECRHLLGGPHWSPHFNAQGFAGKWEVLSLRSPGGKTKNLFAELLGESDYANTSLMDAMPSAKLFLENLGCDFKAVRLLNLWPGSEILPHRDRGLCFEQGEARFHFPVFTNAAVNFFLEEEKICMNAGDSWYINANLEHHVINNSDQQRIHLVADVLVNERIEGLMAAAIKKERVEDTRNEMHLIIAELRRQNTVTANRMADEMEAQFRSYAP